MSLHNNHTHVGNRNGFTSDERALLSGIIAIQSEIAATAPEPNQMLEVITARAQELTNSDGAVVEILEDDEMVYRSACGSAAKWTGLRLRAEGSLSGLCVSVGRVLQCDDSETDPRVNREACRKIGLRSMLVVPLFFQSRPVGVLKVLSREPADYGELEVRAMELMASFIGATLARSMEHAELTADLAARQDADYQVRAASDATRERIQNVLQPGNLTMFVQPIVNLKTNDVVGVEALSRFHVKPPPTPDRWFADAHSVGLGVELEIAAVQKALTLLDELPQDLLLTLNVSPLTTTSPDFESLILSYAPNRVILEITEHSDVQDYEIIGKAIARLRRAGAKLAIDDVGAGFANLRHILRLAPEIIKLDTELTRGIDAEPRKQTLASALTAFAVDTAASIVAEGIETPKELEMLRTLGVHYGQGYYLGRPCHPRDFPCIHN